MQHRSHLSIDVRLITGKPPLPMVHGTFTGIILRVRVIWTLHLIKDILDNLRTIVLVWNHAVWQFIMKPSAMLITTFQSVNGEPALLSTSFLMNSQLPIPLA
ncbi:MAG: hypothetical protein J6B26_02095 [Agathobacter sp.]|nr:hypothetical protein [Agathobacter sp.]